ncbi:hypothetical protein SAMN04487897_102561 [Paenibacillus sp. yr247]|uniref:hypothetical protein n=1 Tax=Paenibacillus sp. yr247 TaxID=1761880 RepID=UPI00088CB54B|nr:hypothetical protein [Paenibacillus sp. yr247]SDN33922.1 hypothetical protein SAMN04487897_102561 [Paenibacillus sp. yr247]
MLYDLFNKFLELSESQRPNYRKSLGKAKENWSHIIQLTLEVPSLFEVIYSSVQGTCRGIKDQRLMDFIPGYRLIHIDEILEEQKILDNLIANEVERVLALPLLVNYSSDYICWVKIKEEESCICVLLHDEGELKVMYRTPEKFLETIIEFYKEEVYFLDKEGYLDYNWEKEGNIGLSLNPSVEYWTL